MALQSSAACVFSRLLRDYPSNEDGIAQIRVSQLTERKKFSALTNTAPHFTF
jgi:hypothetical protein